MRSIMPTKGIYIYIYYIFLCPLRWGEMLLLAATELSCLLKVVVQLLYRKDYDSITVFSYWLVAFPPFFFGLFSHHHLSVSILKRMTGKKKICLMAYFQLGPFGFYWNHFNSQWFKVINFFVFVYFVSGVFFFFFTFTTTMHL